MAVTAAREEWLLAPQAALAGRAGTPDWLASLRAAGRAQFEATGVPTTRDEAFRFTPLSPLATADFALAPAGSGDTARALVEAARLDGTCATLAVVDGHFAPSLSSVSGLPSGAQAVSLAEALRSHGAAVRPVLEGLPLDGQPFAALNAAYLADGVFLSLPAGATLDQPVHVVIAAGPAGGTMAHPRVLITAGANARATVVLTFTGATGAAYFTNAVTQVVLGEGATVEVITDQQESPAAFHLHQLHGRVARSASLHSRAFTLGGRLVRNDFGAVLGGPGAHVTLDGLYLADGQQLVDNHTAIDHAEPHCTSHELYKGILDGQARAVFNGRIIVRPDAQKTDAKQTNRALLLSDTATINSNPQLEIFADDVKCTHGAAVGQLDAEQLFYLQARGLTPSDARDLLLHAFAGQVLDGVGVPAVRARLEAAFFGRLARDLSQHEG